MLLIVIRVLFVCISAGAFATFVSNPALNAPLIVQDYPFLTFLVLMAIVLGTVGLDILMRRKQVGDLSAIYFGLLIGVFLSYLLTLAISPIFETGGILKEEGPNYLNAIRMLAILMLPYFCITFLLQTKDDFRFVIPYVEFSREIKGGRPLILDATALIDGRIADLINTHLLDAELVVPTFVVRDLQGIADSGDRGRRTRGRRGLDMLNKMKNNPNAIVRMPEITLPAEDRSSTARDHQILELAKKINGRIVTNDTNLEKVSGIQGVKAINFNNVANALRPRYVPGELFNLKIMKEGEGADQGIGYLDDGTMVVCEGGKRHIGTEIEVEVTSMLQNSSGRMVFVRQAGTGSASVDR